ncbi:MAG: aromatic amino acid lyase [Gammaproteobacteria bacterium]|nr:MAG: hypothetical protein EP300_01395 [Gammaproteobacteria bacterium]UCH40226.1 MAG: aromatic amino acid lyase [Gammaproteobacteria bacterium]
MIRFEQSGDLNWVNLYRVAYQREYVELGSALLATVDAGHAEFTRLIEQGVPCYGVTTGLGKMVNTELDSAARAGLQANMLRARAAAVGEPFARPVARAMLLIRLVNFLSGRSGVRSDLCCFLVDRLNDNFTPWVPSLGHGMAADAIANTHAFQTLIGEGFVYGPDNQRQSARQALQALGVEPFEPSGREGLALVNGVCAAPALATHAFYRLDEIMALANLVSAVSIEALAASRDAIDPAVARLGSAAGVGKTIEVLRRHLNHSQISPHKLQAPVSYRIIPQVHGAMQDALVALRVQLECCLIDYSDNPLMDGGRLLSVGSFHNQHLVNQVESVALALAHVGSLSERRLHRLLDADTTGLKPQLAARPGLDAGLVVTQKASIDLSARLRTLAQPLSLYTAESSAGQEDYMALAVPAIQRLFDMADLFRVMLAYELLAGLCALRMRAEKPGDSVAAVDRYFNELVPRGDRDRSPGPDVETILQHLDSAAFISLAR